MLLKQLGAVLLGLASGLLQVSTIERGVDAVLVDELGPLNELIHHLVFRHDCNVLPLNEEVTALVACSDADVGVACFAGPIDDTAHHSDLKRQLALSEGLHRIVCHLDDVNLCPSTGRTRNEVNVLALTQTECFEELTTGLGLFDRIGSERIANGVADALQEERGDTSRRLEQSGWRGAPLR